MIKPLKTAHFESIHLVIVCAYHAEASAMISQYKLQRLHELTSFACYVNEDIMLVESGSGKIPVATAVGYIAGLLQMHHTNPAMLAWFNIGIGGHQYHDIGKGYLINKIVDGETNTAMYPDFSHCFDLNTESVITVNKVETQYSQDTIYDMEASGFFTSAYKFTTLEFIQCFKIISDNKKQPSSQINKSLVIDICRQQLPVIDKIVEKLCARVLHYRTIYHTPPIYAQLIKELHFTITQRHQLKSLINRWNLITTESLIEVYPPLAQDNSQSFLSTANSYLDQLIKN